MYTNVHVYHSSNGISMYTMFCTDLCLHGYSVSMYVHVYHGSTGISMYTTAIMVYLYTMFCTDLCLHGYSVSMYTMVVLVYPCIPQQ